MAFSARPKATSISRDLGFDDQSVDFSVDPDMYTKLDIRKAKLGEENAFDIQKIYTFQLEKDIKKLVAAKGRYKDRNKRFLEIRELDEGYKHVAVPSKIATDGNFVEILDYTTEESWKATSRPYGEQAHKRYLDYLMNIPKGPSEDEIIDKQQRALDQELWENIITGKTEPTKKELRQKEKEAAEKYDKMIEERDELDHIKKRRIWREHIMSNDFEELRTKPTEREFNNSMNKWHKGVHYPYDMDEGFPYVAVGILDGTEVVKDRNKYETMAPERIYSSHLYMTGNDGAEQAYREHMITINLNKVDKYLKQRKKEMVREEQMAEELRQIKEKQRRRAGKVERHDLADAIVTAKFNAIQSGNIKVKKIKKSAPGEEGKNEIENEEEDDEWSFSDSSGGFGNKNDDTGDEAAGLQANKQVPRMRPPPIDTGIHSQSPNQSLTGSPSRGPDGSPSRRAVMNIPVFSFDAHGNPVATTTGNQTNSPPAMPRKGTPRKVGFESSEEKSQEDSETENAGFSASSKENSDNSPTHQQESQDTTQYGNKSVKYSSKYVSWAQAGFDAMVIPDFMKETFSRKDSNVAPTPTNSAYNVKNFKQRHIVLRVIIHYVKKAHPKRILYLAVRGYRSTRKFYRKHFSNPDNITRSELRKQQTLKKLGELLEDASSQEYHKQVVSLADTEIPSEEYLPFAKRKQRYLQGEIEKMKDKEHLTAAERLQIEALETRLRLHNETYNARLEREKKATQRVGLIQRYITDTQEQVEATSNFSFWDRQRIHWRTMKQDLVQRAVQLKSNGKKQAHALPEYSKDENDELIIAMHDARLADRQKTAWKRKYRRRWNYFLTHDNRFLEDEDLKVRDVDDLILAARAGNYIEVMDIVMHPTHPVHPNAVNEDGLNAMYATLQMILKQELLDSETDLARLNMSKFQRFVKAMSRTKEIPPKLDLVLRALLYTGGNVDFKFLEPGVDGLAIMHCAAQSGALDMIDWLLKKGTDINIRSALQQKTPLMVALEYNQLDVVTFLLRRGVMIHLELEDENGWTALHYAAVYARPELAVIMLICGAKTTHRNKMGRLASEEARSRGRNETATSIMTFKSDVVEVRSRIDNLMNHTDHQYRQHKKKRNVHKHLPALGGASGVTAGSASAGSLDRLDRPALPPIRANNALAASSDTNDFGDAVVVENSQELSTHLTPSAGLSAHHEEVDPLINTETQDLSNTLPPVHRAAQKEAALLKERKEREIYERRISSIVAAADPWNLAPHTKPRPSTIGIAKMSFYSKSKPKPASGRVLPPVHPKGLKK